jgi:hypothetical protein
MNRILKLTQRHKTRFLEVWHAYFGQ